MVTRLLWRSAPEEFEPMTPICRRESILLLTEKTILLPLLSQREEAMLVVDQTAKPFQETTDFYLPCSLALYRPCQSNGISLAAQDRWLVLPVAERLHRRN